MFRTHLHSADTRKGLSNPLYATVRRTGHLGAVSVQVRRPRNGADPPRLPLTKRSSALNVDCSAAFRAVFGLRHRSPGACHVCSTGPHTGAPPHPFPEALSRPAKASGPRASSMPKEPSLETVERFFVNCQKHSLKTVKLKLSTVRRRELLAMAT
jgi:hypothetical protein